MDILRYKVEEKLDLGIGEHKSLQTAGRRIWCPRYLKTLYASMSSYKDSSISFGKFTWPSLGNFVTNSLEEPLF
jgi:hypothetical protein